MWQKCIRMWSQVRKFRWNGPQRWKHPFNRFVVVHFKTIVMYVQYTLCSYISNVKCFCRVLPLLLLMPCELVKYEKTNTQHFERWRCCFFSSYTCCELSLAFSEIFWQSTGIHNSTQWTHLRTFNIHRNTYILTIKTQIRDGRWEYTFCRAKIQPMNRKCTHLRTAQIKQCTETAKLYWTTQTTCYSKCGLYWLFHSL